MLHRIEDKTSGVQGHTAEYIDQTLAFLREEGYQFVSLEDIVSNLESNDRPLKKAICFTMDDGFLDQANVAAPIFRKHQCSLTMFLITDFLDGKLWPWDDQVRYVFAETPKAEIEIEIAGKHWLFDFNTQSRIECARVFRDKCKELPEQELIEAVNRLAIIANVKIDKTAPESYMPMTWDKARELEKRGVTFASHSMSHRIFSRMDENRVVKEMKGSWDRLRDELDMPLKLFCFPTGRSGRDFGARDLKLAKEHGYKISLSTDPGYVDLGNKRTASQNGFLNRFTLPRDKDELIQICGGIEYIKDRFRQSNIYFMRDYYGGKKAFLRYQRYRIDYSLGRFSNELKIDWSTIDRLVFICKGNICRSPYGAAIAEISHIPALSFGLQTENNLSANDRAIRFACERGVDLQSHMTRKIEEYQPQSRDLVIGMEPAHLKAWSQHYPQWQQVSCTLLGLWCDTPQPYLHDPFSGSDRYFRNCYLKIDNALENIVRKIGRLESTAEQRK